MRLAPKSYDNAVAGIEQTTAGPMLKIHVRAIPEMGKANKALAETVADWLNLPKSVVDVVAGRKSRSKVVSIAGEHGELSALIGARLAELQHRKR